MAENTPFIAGQDYRFDGKLYRRGAEIPADVVERFKPSNRLNAAPSAAPAAGRSASPPTGGEGRTEPSGTKRQRDGGDPTVAEVSDLKGIGKATAQKLAAAGLDSIAALASAEPAAVAEAAGVAEEKAAGWVAQAGRSADRTQHAV